MSTLSLLTVSSIPRRYLRHFVQHRCTTSRVTASLRTQFIYQYHIPASSSITQKRRIDLRILPQRQTRALSSTSATMSGAMYNPEAKAKASKAKGGPPPEPRPSASVVLLSPTNQVLLLRRVKTSSSFASAHVFPGGNLSDFHDGPVPPPGDPARHTDLLPYRLGAIRETFEESGILLARPIGQKNGPLLSLPIDERNRARRAIYKNEVRFVEWLKSVGGEPDIDNLRPFTRWLTPEPTPKRFTTQMYLYMLPIAGENTSASVLAAQDPAITAAEQESQIPTPDGSEVMSARFDDPSAWNQRNMAGKSIMFPPQAFLVQMVGQFCKGPHPTKDEDKTAHYQAQRNELLHWLSIVPTCTQDKYAKRPASQIPWADKCISPQAIGLQADGRAILTLEKAGRELESTSRGGDWERVVLVKFSGGGPTRVEIRDRDEVLAQMKEEREKRKAAESGAKL